MNLQSNRRLLKLRLKSREPESQEPETPEAKATAKEDVPAGPPPGLENEKDELGEARLGRWRCSLSGRFLAMNGSLI
jgi:hypothetical protein